MSAREDFIARYGAIYEHSAWVAERAWDGGASEGGELGATMRRVVERAGEAAQLALINAHPDLGARIGTTLTEASAGEQAGAGLDQCSEAEAAEFLALNERYRNRFGFPFIIAVRGLDRGEILRRFRQRVENDRASELRTALDEVHKIAALRLSPASPPGEREAIGLAELKALVVSALREAGADEANAAAIANTVSEAERGGSESHGLFRVPGYVAAIRSGAIDGRATPRVVDGPPAVVVVEADGAAAPTAYAVGLPALAERTRAMGVAVLALRNARHFAAMWHEVEWLAEEGLAAFAATANFAYLAPHGGRRPVFGTNPIAFAYPREGGSLVFDFASSAMARGDVMIAQRDGRSVPEGVGIGPDGAPTTDPATILKGAQLPFGGHKGSAIALMVELLAGGVVGDLFSDEAPVDESGVPPGGVFVLALDPEAIGGAGRIAHAKAFLDRLAAEPGVRLPGARRHARRREAGPLEVQSALLAKVRELAGGS